MMPLVSRSSHISRRSPAKKRLRGITFLIFLGLIFPSTSLFSAQGQALNQSTILSMLDTAVTFVGTPYVSGGTKPGGFDCSGFVGYLYKNIFDDLPRLSRDMATKGTAVAYGEWQPGDLLFYATGSDPNRINHVALWIGNNRVIHSISDGPETGVVITRADAKYWKRRYKSARRVLAIQVNAEPVIPETADAEAQAEFSPWNSFEGILRGDFEAWKQQDEEAFEAYKREKG